MVTIFYNAKKTLGISKSGGIRTLRHCFATHALEAGVEIFIIKRWMGHSSLKTTYKYIHLCPDYLSKIPAGVLSHDGRRWNPSNDKFLFRVQSLAKEFKKQYLSMVTASLDPEVSPKNSAKLLQQAEKKTWIVYAKKPFAGPEQVLEYLGRYTHRIAIANHRIKRIDNGDVTFTYRDRQHNNELKEMTLSAMEFIRRFLLHVLPFRFMKIRYYGFLANICKNKSILLIRRLIGVDMEARIFIEETLQQKVLRLTGKDISLCSQCKAGRMVYLAMLPGPNTS